MLSDVSLLLRKLSYRESLTAEEAKRALDVIGAEDVIHHPESSDGLFFLALTLGLMAKGPTVDELYGLALSIRDNSVRFDFDVDPGNVIDVSGTGGDRLKTLNVSTAACFVLAGAGVHVAKQATGAYTGTVGSADIFRELGLDIFTVTDPSQVERSLLELRVAGFYPPAFSTGFRNRVNYLQKLRKLGLLYLTPWHLVAWVPSPVPMTSRVYGVFGAEYVEPLARVFDRLGYRNGLVVHGMDGLDEVSTVGKTKICEFRDGVLEVYEIAPEDLGLPTARREDVESRGREDNLESFFRVLLGAGAEHRRDLVAANAGAALYAIGKAPTLRAGVVLALETLENGSAARALERFCLYHGAAERLDGWRERIGL
jgi:anthranilate phosphoribosyltransferase